MDVAANPNRLPDTMDNICGWGRCAVRALDELIDGDDFVLGSDGGVAADERPSAWESNRLDDLLD